MFITFKPYCIISVNNNNLEEINQCFVRYELRKR